MATEAKSLDLLTSKAPNLPIAPTEYSQQYVDQVLNALRLYFNQIDNFTQTVGQSTASTSTLVPSGAILMWSGSIASIPSGWAICDGTNGTPDLRSKFVVGAGSTYAVNATGGSADAVVVSHNHPASSTASDAGHSHGASDSGHTHGYATITSGGAIPGGSGFGLGTFTSGIGNANITVSTGYANVSVTTTTTAVGVSGTNANLPPYLALAYIMKL